MSIGARILDNQNHEYTLTELLGSGAMGGVFLGESTSEPERRIAVKVPHQRLSANQQERFWQELTVLIRLYREDSRFFPTAWRGKNQETNQDVLCLTLARGERLVTFAARSNHHLDYELALTCAEQYAQMLQAMHRIRLSCPDRKPTDLYWDEPTQQLMVIDWNVVAEDEAFDPASDLYIFGRLWYELLTGSLPPPLKERRAHPLSAHPYWSEISVGLQQILANALAPATGGRYISADALYTDIAHYRQQLRLPDADLLQTAKYAIATAETAYKQFVEQSTSINRNVVLSPSDTRPDRQNSVNGLLTEALRFADLARRRSLPASDELWQQAQALETQIRHPIEPIKSSLLDVKYHQALAQIELAETLAETVPATLLALRRWAIVAEVGLAGSKLGLRLSKHLPDFDALIAALTAGKSAAHQQWETLRTALAQADWDLSSETSQPLTYLGVEAAYLLATAEADRAEAQERWAEAGQALTSALAQLQAIPADEPYQTLMSQVYGGAIADLQVRLDELASRQETEIDLQSLYDKLTEQFASGNIDDAVRLFHDSVAQSEREWVFYSRSHRVLLQAGEVVEIGKKLQAAINAAGWDGLLTTPNGLVAQLQTMGRECADPGLMKPIRSLAHWAFEQAIQTLHNYYDPRVQSHQIWHRAKYPRVIHELSILSDHLQQWVEDESSWFWQVMGWRPFALSNSRYSGPREHVTGRGMIQ